MICVSCPRRRLLVCSFGCTWAASAFCCTRPQQMFETLRFLEQVLGRRHGSPTRRRREQ